jgi:hypothetical protein
MIEMLEQGALDVATPVTDAAVVAKYRRRSFDLIGTWVSSPLTWAVVAAGNSNHSSLTDLIKSQVRNSIDIGISRPGSGSETMASYLIRKNPLNLNIDTSSLALRFHTANNFEGLRDGKTLQFHRQY